MKFLLHAQARSHKISYCFLWRCLLVTWGLPLSICKFKHFCEVENITEDRIGEDGEVSRTNVEKKISMSWRISYCCPPVCLIFIFQRDTQWEKPPCLNSEINISFILCPHPHTGISWTCAEDGVHSSPLSVSVTQRYMYFSHVLSFSEVQYAI